MLGKDEEIGELLGKLVVKGDDQDGDGNVAAAKEEPNTDKDAIGKVVDAIAEKDGGAEAVVNVAANTVGAGGTVLARSRLMSGSTLFVEEA